MTVLFLIMNVPFEDEMTRNELFLQDDDHKPRAWFALHLNTMPLQSTLSKTDTFGSGT